METKTIVEEPAFSLRGNAYGVDDNVIEIGFSDLRKAEVGKEWVAENPSNIGRAEHWESLKIVFKDDRGCACLLRRWGTTNEDNPVDWKDEPVLYWVEFQ